MARLRSFQPPQSTPASLSGSAKSFEIRLARFWLLRDVDPYGGAVASDGDGRLRGEVVRQVLPKFMNTNFEGRKSFCVVCPDGGSNADDKNRSSALHGGSSVVHFAKLTSLTSGCDAPRARGD